MKLHYMLSNLDKVKFECCPNCGNLVRTHSESQRKKAVKIIIDTVTAYFGLEYRQVCNKTRRREVVLTRQLIYYFIKERMKNAISLKSMGSIFDLDQDHTTVIHSISTIKDLIYTDPSLRRDIKEIEARLDIALSFTGE